MGDVLGVGIPAEALASSSGSGGGGGGHNLLAGRAVGAHCRLVTHWLPLYVGVQSLEWQVAAPFMSMAAFLIASVAALLLRARRAKGLMSWVRGSRRRTWSAAVSAHSLQAAAAGQPVPCAGTWSLGLLVAL